MPSDVCVNASRCFCIHSQLQFVDVVIQSVLLHHGLLASPILSTEDVPSESVKTVRAVESVRSILREVFRSRTRRRILGVKLSVGPTPFRPHVVYDLPIRLCDSKDSEEERCGECCQELTLRERREMHRMFFMSLPPSPPADRSKMFIFIYSHDSLVGEQIEESDMDWSLCESKTKRIELVHETCNSCRQADVCEDTKSSICRTEERDEWITTVGSHSQGQRNKLTTTKYTVYNFLPKFLLSKFKEPSNFFFLFLTALQMIPGLSPYGWHSTGVPLLVIIMVLAATEVYEDFKRRKTDKIMNNTIVEAYLEDTGQWEHVTWENLQEGQLVYLEKDDFVPADLVVLHSAEPGGVAYIETSNLDGEANLKIRQAVPHTNVFGDREAIEMLLKSGINIVSNKPSRTIDDYTGVLRIPKSLLEAIKSEDKTGTGTANELNNTLDEKLFTDEATLAVPLTANQLIPRGSRLMNTLRVYGVVIYAGRDTKLQLNSTKKASKNSEVHCLTNHIILTQIGWLLFIAAFFALSIKCADIQFIRYALAMDDPGSLYAIFLGLVILYSNLVPISLYVTIYGCLMFQAFYMAQDQETYDENRDMRMEVRSFEMIPTLGKIKYIMSDKTGTLTTNNMRFKFCSVQGVKYGKRNPAMEFDSRKLLKDLESDSKKNGASIKHLLTACVVCHTVVPETKRSSESERGEETVLHASSPDEATLIRFAKCAKYEFKSRSSHAISFTALDENITYRMLAVLEFSSVRKRMGVIVQCPDGKIRLYIKGADTILLARLSKKGDQRLCRITQSHLREFANNGYRTLVFAYRDISAAEYGEWSKIWHTASCELIDRQKKMDEAAELIEKELILLGATAIEDKLQDRVPQTISRLLKADIRVWVLTGDKLETAINIGRLSFPFLGFSCKLLAPRMPILILASTSEEGTRQELNRYIDELGWKRLERRDQQMALIIDAVCLDFIIGCKELCLDFLRLALSCSTVICCRCTPLQKAAVTVLVKNNVDGGVLAIGDGANDVAMIQEADVGVGIAGVEGMQASYAADFSLTQFKHLDRLLLVHGAACYHRIANVIMHTMYKNMMETFLGILYCFYNGHSDNAIADEFTIVRYNLLYTSFTAAVMGIHDAPVPRSVLAAYPRLYTHFHDKLNIKSHLRWAGNAFFHSFIIFCSVLLFWKEGVYAPHGRDGWSQMMGSMTFFTITIVVNIKAMLESRSIHILTVVALLGSIAFFIVPSIFDTYFYAPVSIPIIVPSKMHYLGLLVEAPTLSYFLFLVYVTVACFIFDLSAKALHRTLAPSLLQRVVQSLGKKNNIFDVIFATPFVKICDAVGLKGNLEGGKYGFMFAQDDGRVVSQADLLRMYEGDQSEKSVETAYGITHMEMANEISTPVLSPNLSTKGEATDSEGPPKRMILLEDMDDDKTQIDNSRDEMQVFHGERVCSVERGMTTDSREPIAPGQLVSSAEKSGTIDSKEAIAPAQTPGTPRGAAGKPGAPTAGNKLPEEQKTKPQPLVDINTNKTK